MNSIEFSECVTLLAESGFDMSTASEKSVWGKMDPESVSVGKDHFKPYFRDVFVGDAVGGYYVNSNIVGDFRYYRCRTTYPNTNMFNIFGHGKTPVEAVKNFLVNFKSKRYNIGA